MTKILEALGQIGTFLVGVAALITVLKPDKKKPKKK